MIISYLFVVFGESIMTENNITDKGVCESGASNWNAIGQSQTDESKLRKEGKKYLMRGIIFLVKLILMEVKRCLQLL